MDELLRIGPASRLLGISTSYLRYLTDAGEVSTHLTDGGHRRYDPSTLRREWALLRASRNHLTPLWRQDYPLTSTLAEDQVWAELRVAVETRCGALAAPARGILGYAVTEMVNNAIDHSRGTAVSVIARLDGRRLQIQVIDDGLGVLATMMETLGYESPDQALVDLTKGKRTTAPDRHSGEGIFFTSKAVDAFDLSANGYRASFDNLTADVAFGQGTEIGTTITMNLDLDTTRALTSVFAAHTDGEGEFSRTTPRISLISTSREFISRSEAKRFAAGLEEFSEVVLDFTDVDLVGQGFADELFRVWQREHPDVTLHVTGANPGASLMISRVRTPPANV